jgi:hypothetical protein
MRIGDVVAAVVALLILGVVGTCWWANEGLVTDANRYPFAGPAPVADSAADAVAEAATRAFERYNRPVRTLEELGPVTLPTAARITGIIDDTDDAPSVSWVSIEATYQDSTVRCSVSSFLIPSRIDSTTGRVAPQVMKHCDKWYPRTRAEKEAYYRMERERP